ncbi:hypothetical protein BJ138DRAFT_1103684, partial [Hygrophoropsis aurantiaca]
GGIPLVAEMQNADIIASLISLKKEFEQHTGGTLTLVGAAEAHLLAKEIGEAGVGVILTPACAFPGDWESKRISSLPGPPLTKDSAITTLLAHGVTAALEGDGHITKSQAIALSSVNLEKLLGVASIYQESLLV